MTSPGAGSLCPHRPLTRSCEAGKESDDRCPRPATERVLLDADALGRTLHRIAHEIIEANADLDQVALIGIHTRGVPSRTACAG